MDGSLISTVDISDDEGTAFWLKSKGSFFSTQAAATNALIASDSFKNFKISKYSSLIAKRLSMKMSLIQARTITMIMNLITIATTLCRTTTDKTKNSNNVANMIRSCLRAKIPKLILSTPIADVVISSTLCILKMESATINRRRNAVGRS